MLSYKLIGGGMILGVGTVAAVLGIRRETRKLTVLDGWIDLIAHIRNQIDCYLTPLDEILRAAKLNGLCNTKEIGQPSLAELLQATASGLGEEERRLLNAFVGEIGNGYREDQIRKCTDYLETLRALRRDRAAGLSPRIRVLLALCLGASLGTTILLW